MHIPNDLNRLLAQLQQVASASRQTAGARASDHRPSSVEVELFLKDYNFAASSVEQIEISQDGVFECYMFAIHDRDDLSLLTMSPRENAGDQR